MSTGSARMPSEAEVMGYMDTLSNSGRWGPDDVLGTLNYITEAKRVQAAGLVKRGVSVSCSRVILPQAAPDVLSPPVHYMSGTGESAPAQGMAGASDFLGIEPHGYTVTHIDAMGHIFWNGKGYNGLDARQVNTRGKAEKGGVEVIASGVVTRGVLLDIARVRGVEWMGAGDGITPEDLEAAEKAQNVRVEPGDALLYRTGWPKKRAVEGPPSPPDPRPGMHAASMPWLHERQVALIAADAATDVSPAGYPNFGLPVHVVAICAMGLWVLDGADYEELSEVCARENRWEFQFIMAALRWHHATGSPVNPIAVL